MRLYRAAAPGRAAMGVDAPFQIIQRTKPNVHASPRIPFVVLGNLLIVVTHVASLDRSPAFVRSSRVTEC